MVLLFAISACTYKKADITSTDVLALLGKCCIYKSEIRQGDDTLPAKIEELKIGMTRPDVLALLGESLTKTLFRDNTWIYYYKRRSGGFNVSRETLGVEIIFDDNNKVTAINRLSEKE